MKVSKLRKLQKWILEEPLRFDMNGWTDEFLARRRETPCGTVGCLAGMACHMEGFKLRDHPLVFRIPDEAKKVLGLTDTQADRLFYLSFHISEESRRWPQKFERAYHKAKTLSAKTRVAARRIDHFIATKGAE